ncbi:MAG: hypothetical protein AAF975_03870, partial [Spirochaetota bacterium]
HGDWAAGGKRFDEFYFLNDQVALAALTLKTKDAGLFVKEGDDITMSLSTRNTSQHTESPTIGLYGSEVGKNNSAWKKLQAATGKSIMIYGNNESIGQQFITRIAATASKQSDAVTMKFTLHGIKKSIPFYVEENENANKAYSLKFWILAE